MKKQLFLIAIICVIASAGCKPTKKATQSPAPKQEISFTTPGSKASAKAENFDQFYNRFHNDSMFQISRLRFPIEGARVTSNTSEKWTRKNWQMIKTKVFDVDTKQYKATYKKTEDTFTERVWMENSGFSIECRFKLIDGKWWLVYMKDENY